MTLDFLIDLAVPRIGTWFWNASRDILDSTPLEPVYALNHRQGSNAGRGRGFRRQPDPNPGKFRKFDSDVPRLMN